MAAPPPPPPPPQPQDLSIQKGGPDSLSSPSQSSFTENTLAGTSDTSPSELASAIDDLLNQLTSKFTNISSDLLGKMDDMSRRLDTLEATIQSSNSKATAAGAGAGAGADAASSVSNAVEDDEVVGSGKNFE
ncbi:hypothetical protein AAFC00_003270 [Neodothiora populina]|uniref:Heat shock factor binding protein 1 n=1 Tax=Neodothiora populina TaxID=2781224 RepID=A0ABR3P9W3_9PEZI